MTRAFIAIFQTGDSHPLFLAVVPVRTITISRTGLLEQTVQLRIRPLFPFQQIYDRHLVQ